MKLRAPQHPVNSALTFPAAVPSRRVAHRGLPAAFFEARAARLKYRLILLWLDPSTSSGKREEVIEFADPAKLQALMVRIAVTPARPLLAFRVRAMIRPSWCDVGLDFVVWRANEAIRHV